MYYFKFKLKYGAFKASLYWVHNWKKRNRVVSPKITKTLSRKQIASLPDISKKIEEYRDEVKRLSLKYQPSQIFNTDQSGFNIELLSGRTLETQGQKFVYTSINQSNSGTHSYTIQPIISMSGVMSHRLFIVLQEKGGQFGPRVKEQMFNHPEIFTLATSSGKVSKNILAE